MQQRPARTPTTVRIARWSAMHPWRAFAGWFGFVAVCIVVMGVVGIKQADEVDLGVGEAGQATAMIADGGLRSAVTENVLITSASGGLDREASQVAAADVAQRMSELAEVADVQEPTPSADGTAVLIPVTMAGEADEAEENVDALLEVTSDINAQYPSLVVEQAGEASILQGFFEVLDEDLGTVAVLSVPITLTVLVLAFGALLAAGVPVLLGMSAVASAIGLYALVSHAIPDGGTVTHLVLLIGLAVGVDYSLFYLRREREERAKGRGPLAAIEIAASTSGHSVVVSGLAVAVSMAGLYLAADMNFASMATGAILVVAVAVAGSLTVLPAMLAKLGNLVDRPRIPLVWRLTAQSRTPRFWPLVLRPALRHPVAALVVAVVALLALAAPALTMKLSNPSEENFPRTLPVMQTYDRLVEAFPSANTSHVVAVTAAPGERADVRDAVVDLADLAAADEHFTVDQPPVLQQSTDGRVTVLELDVPFQAESADAEESLHILRDDLIPQTLGELDAEYAVGGEIADNLDYTDNLSSKLPWIIAFVLVLAFVMMTVTFRSVVIGMTTVVVNLLSTVAAFGVLALVFQNTWAEGFLGFTSTGSVVVWIPLFLFVILFGLSMDYHVFIVSRIREAASQGVSTREAVRTGIIGSAGVVTSAAFVMVAVFAVFATMRVVEMKQMGVGLAVAILIDAVIVRAVVLPSAMVLLGRLNWWAPVFLRRQTAQVEPLPQLDPVR